MVNFQEYRLHGISLATALVFFSPLAIEAQETEGGLSWREIGLVGLTVDLQDGQDLGRGCQWENDPKEAGTRGCRVSLATLGRAGVPAVEGTEVNLSDGVFGRERFRLGGRITSISFQSAVSSVFNRSRSTVQAPQEVYRDEKGMVVGAYVAPRVSNEIWRNQRVWTPKVRAHVVWSLYDSASSAVIAERKIKGLATDVGSAIFDSLERFVDEVSDEMEKSDQD